MKATIIDVAAKAGVSVATVSRVVNANYPVKEEIKKKSSCSHRQFAVCPEFAGARTQYEKILYHRGRCAEPLHMFFAEVIDGIEEHLRQDAYSLLLCCAKNDSRQEAKCIMDLMGRNVCGIIVISPNTENMETNFYDGRQSCRLFSSTVM